MPLIKIRNNLYNNKMIFHFQIKIKIGKLFIKQLKIKKRNKFNIKKNQKLRKRKNKKTMINYGHKIKVKQIAHLTIHLKYLNLRFWKRQLLSKNKTNKYRSLSTSKENG